MGRIRVTAEGFAEGIGPSVDRVRAIYEEFKRQKTRRNQAAGQRPVQGKNQREREASMPALRARPDRAYLRAKNRGLGAVLLL